MNELQRDPESRSKWIFYSALDAKTTHELYNALKARLQAASACVCDRSNMICVDVPHHYFTRPLAQCTHSCTVCDRMSREYPKTVMKVDGVVYTAAA